MMRIKNQKSRVLRALLGAAVVVIFGASLANAQGLRRGIGGAGGDRGRSKTVEAPKEVVQDVNVSRGTIQIGSESFRVTPATKLVGSDGHRMRLSDVKPARGNVNGDGDLVEFLARKAAPKGAKLRELRMLTVVEQDYE